MDNDWLLEAQPWVEYRVRLDLLGQDEGDPAVKAARRAMLAHPTVQELVGELAGWPGPVLKSHKDAAHPIHKLAFAADLGLRAEDPGLGAVVERVLSRLSTEGIPQVTVNLKPAYGGTGEDQPAWMLCDAPLVLYALARLGLSGDGSVRAALARLSGLARENGWPCAVSPGLKFRGPGRKDDPCPYANLLMLKAQAASGELDTPAVRVGAETLLRLWAARRERRPYLFGMGSDFLKLKAPLIWYDLLHVVEVLSQFPALRYDPRLLELVAALRAKAGPGSRFTPESIWLAWKGWDFGQKRQPSAWLTVIARRTLGRFEGECG